MRDSEKDDTVSPYQGDTVSPSSDFCVISVSKIRLPSCMFACSLEFHRTLKIITRILGEVVNRERLCGTNALLSVASEIFGAVRPLAKVMTQSIFVWVVGF